MMMESYAGVVAKIFQGHTFFGGKRPFVEKKIAFQTKTLFLQEGNTLFILLPISGGSSPVDRALAGFHNSMTTG